MKRLLFVQILNLSITLCYSQTRINTPYGPQTIPYHRSHINPWMVYKEKDISAFKHDFIIELKNGDVLEANAKIHYRDSISFLEWKSDGKKKILNPNETKSIYHSNYTQKIFKGIPLEHVWVFIVDSAKINTYTITSDYIKSTSITHINKGIDGDIVRLTKENLENMVVDSPKALELVKKNKLVKALKEYNKGFE